ncbi:hypothetical protein DM860_002252 [Cuscuta australis]|uniref:Uncharacterized protein n=1 Tax=Cuscuta australis TaxID=267555 RepID=A0A328CYC1_9ASTE|nr:hypothetical protein DM860_002252 [Cuscuta australis]
MLSTPNTSPAHCQGRVRLRLRFWSAVASIAASLSASSTPPATHAPLSISKFGSRLVHLSFR